MRIKSIRQLRNLKDKRILVRCDFDVPLKQQITNNKQQITKIIDDSRLKACLPTIEYLLKNKAKIILMGHLGRPGGKVVPELSLEPVKDGLEKVLNYELRIMNYELRDKKKKLQITNYKLRITFVRNLNDVNKEILRSAQNDIGVIMLENLRFWPGEENNDKDFAQKLAALADIYVNDAFAVSHRLAASIDAIQNYLPSYAGLQLEKEIKNLSQVLYKPKRPLVVLTGGAKIETKLPVIKQFLKTADYILIGGAVANVFFESMGYEVGKSKVDDNYLNDATKTLKHKNTKTQIVLPVDVKIKGIKNYELRIKELDEIKKDEMILDIGPNTVQLFCAIIKKAGTIVWNGPMGYFENKKFAKGTYEVAKQILRNKKAKSVIGGGETGETIKLVTSYQLPVTSNIFISTGGGAMLEFLAGKKLPGLRRIIYE